MHGRQSDPNDDRCGNCEKCDEDRMASGRRRSISHACTGNLESTLSSVIG
jgi:hypothetical protein